MHNGARLIRGSTLLLAACALLAVASPPTVHASARDGIRRSIGDTGSQSGDLAGHTEVYDPIRARSPDTLVTLIGSYDTPGFAGHVAVTDHLAIVADGSAGLQIIDVANPTTPALIGTYDTPGFAHGVAVAGTLVFVADGNYILQIIDITDPGHPSLVGSYYTGSPFGSARRVAVAGDVALVADGEDGLIVIDVSNPASPTYVSGYTNYPYGAGDVVVEGDVVVASLSQWVLILGAGGSGIYYTPDFCGSVALAGDLAFVVVSGEEVEGTVLRIINIVDPAHPTLVATYSWLEYPVDLDLEVAGNLVFAAQGEAGLQIIDVTDPANPTPFTCCATPGWTSGVAAVGNLAFVAGGQSGLKIMKVSLPVSVAGECPPDMIIPGYSTVPSISLVGFRITNAGATPAALSYNVSAEGPATLMDKGDPAALSGITPLLYPGASYHPPEAGLVIPDIRTHATQRITYVVEDDAYTCETTITFEPPVPVLISAFAATAFEDGVRLTWAVHSDENLVGFKIYRGLEGESIVEEITPFVLIPADVRTYIDGDVAHGKTYQYTLVAVLADADEVWSASVTAKTARRTLTLDQNVPNPFNPTTMISFTLPEPAHATLEIYDVGGRRVRTLVDEDVEEGRREYIWDGRNNNGIAARSGLYFFRLKVGEKRLTGKMVLLK